MKIILLLGAALFTMAPLSQAASCTTGTLSTYLGLGSAGCTIGGDTLSNFQLLSGQTGATAIGAGAVTITPTGTGASPLLTFSTSQTAGANALLESIFTYRIAGLSYTSSSITLSGSSETVDGAVSEVENYCAGGAFNSTGVSGCTGMANGLVTDDGVFNSDSSSLGPASFLNVTNDFTVTGGTAGTASGGVFTNGFTAVAAVSAAPEPASVLLAALGLAVAARLARRRSRFSEIKEGAISEPI